MKKFKDLSRFKSNDLSRYLTRNEIDRYLLKKGAGKKDEKNPFVSSFFAAVLALPISYLTYVNTPVPKNFVALKIAALGLFISLLFILSYAFYVRVVSKMLKHLLHWGHTHTADPDKLKSPYQLTDEYYVSKFHYEVVNQITSALSMMSGAEDEHTSPAQSMLYTSEAYYYTINALKTLTVEILGTNFWTKIKDPESTVLRKYRVEELVPLSEELLGRLKQKWLVGEQSAEHQTDIRGLQNLINELKLQLAEG